MAERTNADDLLRAAREDLARGYTIRGGTRLRQAAAAGSDEAFKELAYALLYSGIPGGGAREARELLERAGEKTTPVVRMLRAELRYAGTGGAAAPQQALDDLGASAGTGLAAAAIELALFWHEQEGADAQAATCAWLTRAAPFAPLAQELLALLPKTAPSANGSPPLPPAEAPARAPANREGLHEEPRIERFQEAFDPLECAWLREAAKPRLAPSLVYDPQTGAPRPDETRTSEAMCFAPPLPSVYARRIAARMSALAGHDAACAEPLTVLRYRPGQEYKPHYDWLGPTALARDTLRFAGDRTTTVLAYLNVPEAGGATVFPRLGIEVRPALGDVLVFSNLDASGTPSRDAKHAGEPVGAGEKWLASLWIRERAVRL